MSCVRCSSAYLGYSEWLFELSELAVSQSILIFCNEISVNPTDGSVEKIRVDQPFFKYSGH